MNQPAPPLLRSNFSAKITCRSQSPVACLSIVTTARRFPFFFVNCLSFVCSSDGWQFLDLFSGSGSVGIEALSRGAGHATFVDFAKDCCDVSAQMLPPMLSVRILEATEARTYTAKSKQRVRNHVSIATDASFYSRKRRLASSSTHKCGYAARKTFLWEVALHWILVVSFSDPPFQPFASRDSWLSPGEGN